MLTSADLSRRAAKFLAASLTLILFVAALWVLHSEIAKLHWTDITQALGGVRYADVVGALAFTGASYLFVTLNEWFALHYIGKPLGYRVAARNAFIAYAFAHSIGLSLLTGGSVRYRLYSAYGLSASEIALVTGFAALTFGLGVLAIGGASLVIDPRPAVAALFIPQFLVTALSVVGLALCATYVCIRWIRKAPVRIGAWAVPVPSPRLASAQLLIGTADLLASGAVAYLLLPQEAPITFVTFCAAYVLAIFASSSSHVPGGIGVFEAAMLVLLPQVPGSELLAALVLYRLIYYIVPLFLGAALWTTRETTAGKAALARTTALLQRTMAAVGAPLVGLAVFIGGTVLLLSGVIPAVPERIATLRHIVPLPLIEASHLAASVSGFLLLILARGLFRRSSGAYYLTVLALLAGIVFSLLKGFDYEEALVCGGILTVLVVSRPAFYRRSTLLEGSFTASWVVSIAIVIAGVTWIGFFVNRDLSYSDDLWTQFAFDADAPRFLRASLAVALAAAGLGVAMLIAPAQPQPAPPDSAVLTRVRRIVSGAPDTAARLALLGDKSFLFSSTGRAFIMYGVRGRSWVALGSPVGAREEWADLLWQYRDLVDRHDGHAAFYQVDAEHLPLYLDLGLTLYKVGEEALLPLGSFTLEGHERKELRRARTRGEREGLSFAVLDQEATTSAMSELHAVSDAWLKSRKTSEKRFSLGFFEPSYVASGPVAVVRQAESIIAFANVLEAADHRELSVDLMRHRPDAPHGTMDFLFAELLLHGAKAGFEHFNMGLAPLSGLSGDRLAPLWHKIGNLIFAHAGRFYNFEGLRDYKEKFRPIWRPKYLATDGGLTLPAVLVDLAALISGGLKDLVVKSASSAETKSEANHEPTSPCCRR